MDIRLEKEYERLISNLYVIDGDEYICAAEAELYLPVGCNLTDCYDEFFEYDAETGEYNIDSSACFYLNEMENELFNCEEEDF